MFCGIDPGRFKIGVAFSENGELLFSAIVPKTSESVLCAALARKELHLLDEYNPHVRVTVILLRVIDADWHEVTVLLVLRTVGAALFTDFLDIRTPRIDEVDILACEFLEQNAILRAHAAGADDCVFHLVSSLGCRLY